MIIGTYPCCGGDLWIGMPDKTPAFAPEDCPHCGARVWHRFSRVQSMTWTEADFLAEHEVDGDARTVVPKPGTAAERFNVMTRELSLAVQRGEIDLAQAVALAAAVPV